MAPKKIKGISGSHRATYAPTTNIIPSPPQTCDGYMYTVRPRDTLYSISRKFNCSVMQLLQANPQISSRSGTLFIRQRICIPDVVILPIHKLLPVGPKVLFVELLDSMGNPLRVMNGFVSLAPRTFIRAVFSEPVSQVFFFFVPSRRKIFRPSFLIGERTLVPPGRSVRFIWDVPRGIRGSLFIVGCTERICGPPEEILVRRP
ncbi:LysM peptidoglycan-binding domain-containing protein [Dethiobacter alkaliphilus]|uniref:LysM peptidoglycan-binding domain-containing protein n=1 Tax=Dethiobacter alkaliphilus TaxID=427926 RepID=UPI002226D837|nr:LysM peptidoglycan-binding domain-containing protein [Dethiobacter alkaliphilus]MCW3489534.1 LysM peptidoglycan-binding domain-containing protein [Dethiobacter alkaliphilus]